MPACRCKYCGARRTLAQHPSHYLRPPRCRSCGRKEWRVDKYRHRVERKIKPCRCGNYSFPHAKGRGYCIHNPNLTEEDMKNLYEGAFR